MRFSTSSSPMLVLLVFVVAACTSTPPPVVEPSPIASLPTDLQIHWVRTAAEYPATLAQTYNLATERLSGRIEAHRQAEGNVPWAVVLDADETVIDNSLYQYEQAQLGKGFERTTWRAWVARKEAPPLPGALAFLQRVDELGGTIAIVTNRRAAECADTEANFEKYSIPFDVILCRSAERSKAPRWAMVEDGSAADHLPAATILMWVGDNIFDFPDVDQNTRGGGLEGYSDFGERFFIIPNPMYGSWEDNPRG